MFEVRTSLVYYKVPCMVKESEMVAINSPIGWLVWGTSNWATCETGLTSDKVLVPLPVGGVSPLSWVKDLVDPVNSRVG